MEIVVRIGVLYVALLVGLRVLGKREFGELSPFDLVTLLLIPEIVSGALTGEDVSLTGGLIGVATLLSLVFLTSLVTHRFKAAQRLVDGSPTVLVAHGKLLTDRLNKERIDTDEILGAMHKAGLERLEQVAWAVLETDGKISIVPAQAHLQQQAPASDEKPVL